MCSRFFIAYCIVRSCSRCCHPHNEKRAQIFQVTRAFFKRYSWAIYFVDDLMSEEHNPDGNMYILPTPPTGQLQKIRLSTESPGKIPMTHGEGQCDEAMEEVQGENSMDDLD